MAPVIETARKPTSRIELIAKVQHALERAGLSQIRTHDVSLAIFCQTATSSITCQSMTWIYAISSNPVNFDLILFKLGLHYFCPLLAPVSLLRPPSSLGLQPAFLSPLPTRLPLCPVPCCSRCPRRSGHIPLRSVPSRLL